MTTPETAVHVATSEAEFRRAIDIVYQRIAVAAQRVDRAPEDIRLLPVSKTVPEDRMRAAYAAGLRQFGENKVQEAQTKAEAMNDLDVHWAVIGALQSNKTRDVAQFAHEFQALDRLRIARRLDNQLQEFGRSLDVYVQVNASGEHTKSGLHPDDVEDFLERLQEFQCLKVRGLMTMALHTTDEAVIRQNFAVVRGLRDELREHRPALIGDGGLSMGMSNDYEIAIEEGATVVRVGSAIFGARDYSK
ncbi:MAG TPA: YggS family pyridoxal phosphate-dependent enzyme [Candidatus Yaniella excrementigallinarum]|nr:YggS family pyridoxal phosphate-dependent enzyme [Candidatus Yaniella excrementigallinarum]